MAASDAAYDTFGRERGYEKSPGDGRENEVTRFLEAGVLPPGR